MMMLNRISRTNIPVGYFKRIVNAANNTNLKVVDLQTSNVNINSRPGGGRRCDVNEEKFSILRVNSKLVDKKNLNKYLKKIWKRDYTKEEIKYLLKYIVNNMNGSLDDGNLLIILIMMSKLEIKDKLLFDSLLPCLYKIEDFNKITDCLLYSSMMFGGDEGLKVVAIKVIYDLPKYTNYVTYDGMAKLCESLCHMGLYSEDFGKLISTLVCKDALSSGQVNMLNLSSILNYLSRVRSGDGNAWKLYMKYSLDNMLSSNHKVITKLLQSCINRNVFNKKLFSNCGDSLARLIDCMHPNDVANVSYYYFKMNYKHDGLFGSIFKIGERIATNMDPKSSLKLLSGYQLYFTTPQSKNHPLVSPSQPMQNNVPVNIGHLCRTVYLIYNNISNGLNSLDFEEFLLLFRTLETFEFINARNLRMNLDVFLSSYGVSPALNPSKVDLIKSRYTERRSIDLSQHSFIRSLIS